MKKIKSFQVDHTKLKKGLYVLHVDRVGLFSHVTTFDLRMKTPYVDRPIAPATAHAMEHCLATYLRDRRDDVLYVGPMGCMTGFYVILKGKRDVDDLRLSLIEACEWILSAGVVPGSTMEECGNYKFMNLQDAKEEAFEYWSTLMSC